MKNKLEIISSLPSITIGITDKKSEGDWRWFNNFESDFINWAINEPNNYGMGENFAELIIKPTIKDLNEGKEKGSWNDFDSRFYKFLFEWDFDPLSKEIKKVHNYNKLIKLNRYIKGCKNNNLCGNTLKIPSFKDAYSISSYRRFRMVANKYWQNTDININFDEKVFIIGSGKVINCPHCQGGEPRSPINKDIWLKIKDNYSGIMFDDHHEIYSSLLTPNMEGRLEIVLKDWLSDIPYNNNDWYNDNLGFCLFDIFTYNKNDEQKFKLFLIDLMKLNKDDLHSNIIKQDIF